MSNRVHDTERQSYDARVPGDSQDQRLAVLLLSDDEGEPGKTGADFASLVELLTSEPRDEAVLSELVRRAVQVLVD